MTLTWPSGTIPYVLSASFGIVPYTLHSLLLYIDHYNSFTDVFICIFIRKVRAKCNRQGHSWISQQDVHPFRTSYQPGWLPQHPIWKWVNNWNSRLIIYIWAKYSARVAEWISLSQSSGTLLHKTLFHIFPVWDLCINIIILCIRCSSNVGRAGGEQQISLVIIWIIHVKQAKSNLKLHYLSGYFSVIYRAWDVFTSASLCTN